MRQRWDLPDREGARYEHKVLFCGSWWYTFAVAIGGGIYGAVLPMGAGGVLGKVLVYVLLLVLLAVPIIFAMPRSSRSVRVDDEGVWVSGDLVVPAADIVAFAPYGVLHAAGAGAPRLGRSWSYSTILAVRGLRHPVEGEQGLATVAVPLWQDGSNTGGAMTPGVVVVTREVVGGSYVGWVLVSWRRARLLDALRVVARGAFEGSDRGWFSDDAGYEAIARAKQDVRAARKQIEGPRRR